MSSSLDSPAVFRDRCRQLTLDDAVVQHLLDSGLDTLSKYAYSSSYTPGSPDDTPFTNMIAAACGGALPNAGQLALLRRLLMEAHTMSLQDMRSKVDRTEDSPALKLQPAERAARYDAQRNRLNGLDLSGPLECSHYLIDAVCQQYEDNTLRYLPVEALSSRDQELAGEGKRDKKLEEQVGIARGKLVVKAKKEEVEGDVSTDLRIRHAWTRRSLAYDQAGLITFEKLELWVMKMINRMHDEPPPKYSRVTLAQCLDADRRLWTKLGESCRSGIQPVANPAGAGMIKPLDVALEKWMDHPEVTFLLVPLPKAKDEDEQDQFQSKDGNSRTSGGKRQKGQGKGGNNSGNPNKKHKGGAGNGSPNKGGGKGQGRGKGQNRNKAFPKGCISVLPDGRRVCYGFNGHNGCTECDVGMECSHGWHLCGKFGCGQEHSMQSCPKK